MDALEVWREIQEAARGHRPDVRRVATMEPGDVVRQGDVYLTCVAALPAGLRRARDGQLALGSTQGSRHVLRGDAARIGWPPASRSPLQGPYIDSPEERVYVAHPEHGHLDLPPGRYSVTYQRDYAREREAELRPVVD
jgi:hypothetical protein